MRAGILPAAVVAVCGAFAVHAGSLEEPIGAIVRAKLAAALDLVFADGWEGCSTSTWANSGAGGGAVGSPVAGEPDDPTPVPRYSGRCAQRSDSAGNYVRDVSPASEPTYRVRFYVFPDVTGIGEALVFRSSDAVLNDRIRVSYDSGAAAFKVYAGPDATPDGTVPADRARWYSIELKFSNAGPAELRYSVQGAGSETPLANDLAVTSGIGGTDVIDTSEIGWIANVAGTPTGRIVVDAFESRRTTAIGRLCRGDANGNATIAIVDAVAIAGEILATALASGQPDCTEDGAIDVRDRACVVKRVFAAQSCP